MTDKNYSPLNSLEADEEERKNFHTVLTCFRQYKLYSLCRVNKTEKYINTLNNRHKEMLSKYHNHLNKVRDCIDTNDRVLREIIKHPVFSENISMTTKDVDGHATTKMRLQDLETPKIETFKSLKVQTTLKQIARDWSSDGAEERKQCYQPIIEEILNFYDPSSCNVNDIKVLVPGAGLGRLLYELACRGYSCEGNEMSLFMLFASDFVLNKCEDQEEYTIHPWVHQYCNNLNRCEQVAPVKFPDISPKSRDIKGSLKIAAGDFNQVYTESDYWDCVATCFFIDCTNNVIEFIETIYRILSPGAIWVNLGPLLYHFSDVQGEESIEPTFEDILSIMKVVGFEVIKYKTGQRTKYAQNPRSMLKTEYESILWVCKKPLNPQNDQNYDSDE